MKLQANDKPAAHWTNGDLYYTARGVEYQFETYDNPPSGSRWASCVVYAINREGKEIWQGPAAVYEDSTALQIVRDARYNAENANV